MWNIYYTIFLLNACYWFQYFNMVNSDIMLISCMKLTHGPSLLQVCPFYFLTVFFGIAAYLVLKKALLTQHLSGHGLPLPISCSLIPFFLGRQVLWCIGLYYVSGKFLRIVDGYNMMWPIVKVGYNGHIETLCVIFIS